MASFLTRVGGWVEQTPPFSWAIAVDHWLADHLIRPWVDPYLHRFANREAAEYAALAARARLTGLPAETVDRLEDLHRQWVRRAEETAP